jgi:hypothetical protein
LSLIREDSWNSDAFIKPKIEKIASEKDSDNGSQLNLENYLPENNNGFVEDIENKISSLGNSFQKNKISRRLTRKLLQYLLLRNHKMCYFQRKSERFDMFGKLLFILNSTTNNCKNLNLIKRL